jgi:predicted GH43/DUF377 family glycosyl hydrolase
LATSHDLFHWEKHGVLFPDWKGDHPIIWSKSGAILPEKIGGKYVMYFGDTSIWIATSDDAIHWEPDPEPVLRIRPEPAFDSVLVEPGAPPLLTEEGILLIYNAAQFIHAPGTKEHGKVFYSAGQVLFSRENPAQVVKRTEIPFFEPEAEDERSGQVDYVVFVEGLVQREDTWYLYYGMADSKIGVAVYRP